MKNRRADLKQNIITFQSPPLFSSSRLPRKHYEHRANKDDVAIVVARSATTVFSLRLIGMLLAWKMAVPGRDVAVVAGHMNYASVDPVYFQGVRAFFQLLTSSVAQPFRNPCMKDIAALNIMPPGLAKIGTAPFENMSNFSGDSSDLDVGAWKNGSTTMFGSTVAINNTDDAGGDTAGGAGLVFLGLQHAGAYIEQAVPTKDGSTYSLSYMVAKAGNRLGQEDATIKITVDGKNVTEFQPAGSSFEHKTATFTASGDISVIRFENASPPGDKTVFVDMVHIEKKGIKKSTRAASSSGDTSACLPFQDAGGPTSKKRCENGVTSGAKLLASPQLTVPNVGMIEVRPTGEMILSLLVAGHKQAESSEGGEEKSEGGNESGKGNATKGGGGEKAEGAEESTADEEAHAHADSKDGQEGDQSEEGDLLEEGAGRKVMKFRMGGKTRKQGKQETTTAAPEASNSSSGGNSSSGSNSSSASNSSSSASVPTGKPYAVCTVIVSSRFAQNKEQTCGVPVPTTSAPSSLPLGWWKVTSTPDPVYIPAMCSLLKDALPGEMRLHIADCELPDPPCTIVCFNAFGFASRLDTRETHEIHQRHCLTARLAPNT
eukprot:TRINITY_DN7669_c0_g1_i1.p1 TRINITY_DN7669_c0_g1~~TRINITY_DN7669_c0_g1_i1.p1  ORF type:complete len:602 (-),score=109.37 TRINITY_DN7669_c0_g1_i1:161-1966(-)